MMTQDIAVVRNRVERLGGYESDAFIEKDAKELIMFAIKKEGESVRRYKRLASLYSGELKALFHELETEEMEHARILSDILEKLR